MNRIWCETAGQMLLSIMLFAASLQDIRSREISVRSLEVSAGLAFGWFVWALICGAQSLFRGGCGLLLGFACFLLGRVSGGQVGEADAVLIGLMGLILGPVRAVMRVWMALFCAMAAGLLLTAYGKHIRKSLLPFAPFLLLGQLIGWLWR